ncbi:MAG TPA: hypothetical protein VLI05_06735 [Candidatus Saccharimonadia bacterium]|nr:hypothetical protein [Candidatus Saccharimonadia bacterium]
MHSIIRHNLRDPKLAYYLNWRDDRAVGHILLRELATATGNRRERG